MFSALGRENPETFPFVINKFSALADYRAGGRQTTTEARVARLRRAASSHFPRTYSSLQSSRCQGKSFPTEPCLSLASVSGGPANANPVPAAQTVPLPAAPAILTSVAHCNSLNRRAGPRSNPGRGRRIPCRKRVTTRDSTTLQEYESVMLAASVLHPTQSSAGDRHSFPRCSTRKRLLK